MAASRQPIASLTVTRGPEAGRGFAIGATTVTIGRYGECDIQMRDSWVSRWHARVSWNGIEYIVEDLGSTNGTYINGVRVGAPRALRSGDRLQLGEQVEFAFQVGVPVPSARVAVPSGIRPSPGSRVSPSQAMPTFAKPVAEQKGSPNRRRRVGVWAPAALIGLLILIIGGGVYYLLLGNEEGAATHTREATVTPILTPTVQPVIVQGRGSTRTQEVALPASISVATLTHRGESTFKVTVHYQDRESEWIVFEWGAFGGGDYSGDRPVMSQKPVSFEVEADGSWSIELRPIGYADSPKFSGKGDMVSGLFQPPSIGRWRVMHTGRLAFWVTVTCAGGRERVVDEQGRVDGVIPIAFPEGPCFWDVLADGQWSLAPED